MSKKVTGFIVAINEGVSEGDRHLEKCIALFDVYE